MDRVITAGRSELVELFAGVLSWAFRKLVAMVGRPAVDRVLLVAT